MEMFNRFGKSRITLKAQIKRGERIQAAFEGEFVAIKKAG